jgi:hypothetical protein
MTVCVCSVFVLSCVRVAALRRAGSLARSPADCVEDRETEGAAGVQQRGCRAIDIDR